MCLANLLSSLKLPTQVLDAEGPKSETDEGARVQLRSESVPFQVVVDQIAEWY